MGMGSDASAEERRGGLVSLQLSALLAGHVRIVVRTLREAEV